MPFQTQSKDVMEAEKRLVEPIAGLLKEDFWQPDC
jgi:hypothetical protein